MMFVVMRLQDFEVEPAPNQRFRLPLPVTIDSGKMVGFLPVYDTREDALLDFPEAKLMEIKETHKRRV